MTVMIEDMPRLQRHGGLRQALHDAMSILWCGAACVVAVSVPVLLRVLAFFPE